VAQGLQREGKFRVSLENVVNYDHRGRGQIGPIISGKNVVMKKTTVKEKSHQERSRWEKLWEKKKWGKCFVWEA